MTFMSNNLTWAASTIVDLYKAIEAFFKQLNKPFNSAAFSDTTKTRFNGKYGWHCWSIYYFVSWPI